MFFSFYCCRKLCPTRPVFGVQRFKQFDKFEALLGKSFQRTMKFLFKIICLLDPRTWRNIAQGWVVLCDHRHNTFSHTSAQARKCAKISLADQGSSSVLRCNRVWSRPLT